MHEMNFNERNQFSKFPQMSSGLGLHRIYMIDALTLTINLKMAFVYTFKVVLDNEFIIITLLN